MQKGKIKYLQFAGISILFLLLFCVITSTSKVEETYIIENEKLPDTIPLLAMEKMEVLKGPLIAVEWDWRSNEISKGQKIPLYFKEGSALLYYCRWDGNRIALHADFLDKVVTTSDAIFDEFETVDGSSNLVFNHLQEENYTIKCDEKEMQLQLPKLTHAFAGPIQYNKGWLLILTESDNTKYGIKCNLIYKIRTIK